jgi:hypothetical protein
MADCAALSRPHTQEKAESEKRGMADWVRRVQTTTITREGRELRR